MNLSPKINSYIQYVKYICSRKHQPGKPVCLMVLNINCHIKLPGSWKACTSVWTTHGYDLPTALCMWHRPRTPPYSTVCYHVPSPWHGALSLRRCQRTPPPLSGGFCHAATATSPPFFFPFFFFVSHWDSAWHADNARFLAHFGKGWIRNSIRLLPHICPSTDHHGPMPTCKWVFFVVFLFFFTSTYCSACF